MSSQIIQVQNISKLYRLGQLGAGSLREDVAKWWTRARRKSAVQCPENEQTAPKSQDFWALKDVSFEVRQGEVLGIIGRNGAGKSTLLKILARVTQPTSGEAILRGRVASLLEVGTGFHPELSGRDNVFLNGAILGMRKAEVASKFDEIVAFAEVEQFIDTPVKRYSSGMYVRLAFAVAAHLEPEILIVDEVLAVGDAAFQQKCLGKMQDVATSQGRTVLFVSHHMSAVRRLCRKCLVLDKGMCAPVTDVDDAVTQYNSQIAMESSAFDVETDQIKRGHGHGREARITRVKACGQPPLMYGGPLCLEFCVEVKAPVRNAMIGIGFDSVEGGRIMTLDSDAGGVMLNLQPGFHSIVVTLPELPLHPASYVVHCSIGSGGYYFDALHRFAVWEVATSASDLVSDRGFGGCRLIPGVVADSGRGRIPAIDLPVNHSGVA